MTEDRRDPSAQSFGTGASAQDSQGDAPALSVTETDILVFERLRWKHPAAKEAEVLDRFGMSATRYYQVLNALIDRPEALAADPLLVMRLRRLRDRRRLRRSRRTHSFDAGDL